MVAREVFVKYYSFNPIKVQHSSIHVKKVLVLKSKKIIVKVLYLIKFIRMVEPQFGFAALRSRSRKKYFRLRNTALWFIL